MSLPSGRLCWCWRSVAVVAGQHQVVAVDDAFVPSMSEDVANLVTRLAENFFDQIGLPADLPDLALSDTALTITPRTGEFSLAAESANPWRISLGAAGLEHVAARTGDLAENVIGVDSSLHDSSGPEKRAEHCRVSSPEFKSGDRPDRASPNNG